MFFPSFAYADEVYEHWQASGALKSLSNKKARVPGTALCSGGRSCPQVSHMKRSLTWGAAEFHLRNNPCSVLMCELTSS